MNSRHSFLLIMELQGRSTVQNFGVAATNATPKYWGGRWGGRNKGTPKYWGGRGHPGHPSSAGPGYELAEFVKKMTQFVIVI